MKDFIESITVYRDDDILIVNKPSGLLSVPGKGDLTDSLLTRLIAVDPNTLLIHRLDRDTSGLLVFALNKASQTHISKQFAARVPTKIYQAIIYGAFNSAFSETANSSNDGKGRGNGSGQITIPVRYNPLQPPLHITDIDHPKPAITLYQTFPTVLYQQQPVTPILLQPYTGRSHQLRVHMQHVGHPIVNDGLYATQQAPLLSQLALHAAALSFLHPVSQKLMQFYQPAPFINEMLNFNQEMTDPLSKQPLLLPTEFIQAVFNENIVNEYKARIDVDTEVDIDTAAKNITNVLPNKVLPN